MLQRTCWNLYRKRNDRARQHTVQRYHLLQCYLPQPDLCKKNFLNENINGTVVQQTVPFLRHKNRMRRSCCTPKRRIIAKNEGIGQKAQPIQYAQIVKNEKEKLTK